MFSFLMILEVLLTLLLVNGLTKIPLNQMNGMTRKATEPTDESRVTFYKGLIFSRPIYFKGKELAEKVNKGKKLT